MTKTITKTIPALSLFLLLSSSSSLLAQESPAKDGSAAELREGRAKSPALEPIGPDAELLKLYAVPEADFPWSLKSKELSERVQRWSLTFPSEIKTDYEPNNTVHGEYFQAISPKGASAKAPAIIILHHLAGGTEPEEALAMHCARQGVHALVLTLPFYGPRRPKDLNDRLGRAGMKQGLEMFSRVAQQAVHDVRRAADALRSFAEVDAERVALAGVSLGAIVGSLAAGVDARFDRVVLILGGGRLDEIVFGGAREVRDLRRGIDELGLDKASVAAIVRPIEPTLFAHRIPRERVLMLNASRDEVIPESATLALHEALGKPQIHWYKTGHYGSALHIFNVMRRTLSFVRSEASER
jgi:dienelactone hydrolase